MIVKVQRPVAASEPDPPWIVYDQKRKVETFIPDAGIPDNVRKAMKGDYRGYFNATIEDGVLVFGNRLVEQDW